MLGQDFRGRSAGQDFGVGQLDRTAGTGEPEHDSWDRTATARRGKKVQNSHMTTRTGQLNKTTEKKKQWQDSHDRTFETWHRRQESPDRMF